MGDCFWCLNVACTGLDPDGALKWVDRVESGPYGCILLMSISGRASPNNAADTSGDNKVVMARRRHLSANIYRAGCVNDHDQVTAALVKISQKNSYIPLPKKWFRLACRKLLVACPPFLSWKKYLNCNWFLHCCHNNSKFTNQTFFTQQTALTCSEFDLAISSFENLQLWFQYLKDLKLICQW